MNGTHDRTSSNDTMGWADLGSCVGRDPDLFFPERGADTSRARALCRSCPVRSECLDYALQSGQKFGIWGGMTPAQRRRLVRPEKPTNPEGRHLRLVPAP
jgi:WhiB family transcriptional regulator, redox-sensing transcriptional regulator